MKSKVKYGIITVAMFIVFMLVHSRALAITDISEGYPENSGNSLWPILAMLFMGLVVIYAAAFYLLLADGNTEDSSRKFTYGGKPRRQHLHEIIKKDRFDFDNNYWEPEEIPDIGGEA